MLSRYKTTMAEAIKKVYEDGHIDVPSAKRKMKLMIEDANQIMGKLNSMNDEDKLPSWWMDMINTASDNMNSARDYFLTSEKHSKQTKGEKNEDKDMDPAKHVARSKRNPDKFCVFDKDGNEVKLFDKEADAVAYAKANHDKLMEDLNEFKKMIVTVKNPSKRKEMMKDIMRFGKHTGFRIDKMRDGKSFKIDGKGADLNKFAIDMKNYYGAEIKAESYEPLEEFTDAQIARLKKEYEPLKGKETGVNPEKFAKLRKLMDRFSKPQLLKLVDADIPILTSAAKAKLVIKFGMKWKQLPEELIPYIDIFADNLRLEQKGKFKSVDPKVIDRIEKMMRGSRAEKDSIANMLNYLMPPEVVDMVRYKLKIVPKRGKIKF